MIKNKHFSVNQMFCGQFLSNFFDFTLYHYCSYLPVNRISPRGIKTNYILPCLSIMTKRSNCQSLFLFSNTIIMYRVFFLLVLQLFCYYFDFLSIFPYNGQVFHMDKTKHFLIDKHDSIKFSEYSHAKKRLLISLMDHKLWFSHRLEWPS